MTDAQKRHLVDIEERFLRVLRVKFEAGAKEHGGTLLSLPATMLLNEAINEAVDQVAYLFTLKMAFEREGIQQTDEEEMRATVAHGSMTKHTLRAMGILGEEVGEAHKAALEIDRQNGQTAKEKLAALSNELVQIMSVTRQIWRNIQEISK